MTEPLPLNRFGATSLNVTPLCMGCSGLSSMPDTFGYEVSEDQALQTLRAFFQSPINYLDTAAGYGEVVVKTVYAPAWTTDWMPAAAREKLKVYGIAPPGPAGGEPLIPLGPTIRTVTCPYCGSANTTRESEFGPTACKSLHVCHSCRQPFEHFKAF